MAVLRNLRVAYKLSAALFLIICLGFISFLTLYRSARSYASTQESIYKNSNEALIKAQEASGHSKAMAFHTLAYVGSRKQSDWDAKMSADESAGATFEEVSKLVAKIPNNTDLHRLQETFSSQDEDVCNPLENKILGLAKSGKTKEALRMLNERYIPEREKLEDQISAFIVKLQRTVADQHATSEEALSAALRFALIVEFLVIVFSAAVGVFLTRYIVGSLRSIRSRVDRITDRELTELGQSLAAMKSGDLTVSSASSTTPLSNLSKDEFGDLGIATNRMLHIAGTASSNLEAARTGLSAIIRQIQGQAQFIDEASEVLGGESERISGASFRISDAASEASHASNESATTTEDIAKASERLAIDAGEATVAMEDLQKNIESVQCGSNAQRQASESAASTACHSSQSVEQTITSMERIRLEVQRSSSVVQDLGNQQAQIGMIVQAIEDIAEQTNLLALNAAIEAARAGEQGRGFAVVADEVRKLAERSGAATKEIAAMIEGVKSGVETAVQAMQSCQTEVDQGAQYSDQARKALTEIAAAIEAVNKVAAENEATVGHMLNQSGAVMDAFSSVAAISQETAASAQEMSATAHQVSDSIVQVSTNIESQTTSIEKVDQMAQNLRGVAHQLKDLVESFKVEKEEKHLRLAA